MKRGVVDLLRRGFDNTIANWPVILIRLAETVLVAAVIVASIIAVVVPLFISIGISFERLRTMEDIEMAADLLVRNGVMVIVYTFALATVVALVLTAVHSFVIAGCARVYADGDRLAGAEVMGPRMRYAVFSMDRWMSGSTSGWWTLFLIYNIAWGSAGIVLLLPLIPTLAAMLLVGDTSAELAVGLGCLGILLTLFLGVLTTIIVTLWSTRAIAVWAHRRNGAREALAIGWRAVRGDLARHLLIGVAIFVIGMAGSSFFGSLSFFGSFASMLSREHAIFEIVAMPVRALGWILSSAFSAAVGGWFLSSYCAIENETVS